MGFKAARGWNEQLPISLQGLEGGSVAENHTDRVSLGLVLRKTLGPIIQTVVGFRRTIWKVSNK